MDGLFSPVATRRCVGTALPEVLRSRLARRATPRGVFFWLLFLHEQEKSLARDHIHLLQNLNVKTGEITH